MNKVERMKLLATQKWASQLVIGHYKSRERGHVFHRLNRFLFREGTSLKKIIMDAVWWRASSDYYDWEPIYQETSNEPLRG